MKTLVEWCWSEAFDKFGFNDGDGLNFTDEVACFIESLGYEVECEHWGIHNYMVQSIKCPTNGELMDQDKFQIGYDEPEKYLPSALVKKLQEKFPDH